MANCSIAKENICAYIDNELNIADRLSFEEHVKSCRQCKSELDEMLQLVGLCKDLPQFELPVDFKAELHEKLLAAAYRKESNTRSIKKSKGFLFTKAFASIAAGLLLILLAGSFYRFGLLPSMKSQDSLNNTAMAAEQPAAGMKENAAAFGDIVGAGNTAGVNRSAKAFSAQSAANDDSSEAGRSSTLQDRETALAEADGMLKKEAAASKLSTITITAEDPGVQAEKVKALALENGGDEADDQALSTGTVTGPSTENETSIKSTFTSGTASEPSQAQLNFMIPDTQYDQFIAAVNTAFGEVNVQVGAFVTEDMTDTLKSSIARSNEIDSQIQELQKKDGKENTEEINDMKKEKDVVDSRIEKIRLGSDFVNVTVLIIKK
jgi:anti-sigma factor RsiW